MSFVNNLFIKMFHFFIRVWFIWSTKAAAVFFVTQIIEMLTLNLNEKLRRFQISLKLVEKHDHLVFVILESSYEHLLLFMMPLLEIFLHHLLKTLVCVISSKKWLWLHNRVTSCDFSWCSFFPAGRREVVESVWNSEGNDDLWVYVFQIIRNADRHVDPLGSSLKCLDNLL